MEYKLVTADSASYLQQLVNNYIKDGFKPKGDIQIIIDSQYNRHDGTVVTVTIRTYLYIQKMTKKN